MIEDPEDEGNDPVPTEGAVTATNALIEEIRAATDTALTKTARAAQAAAAAIRDKDLGDHE